MRDLGLALHGSSRAVVRERASGRRRHRSSSASGTRRRTAAPPSPTPVSRSSSVRATGRCSGVEPLVGALGEPRHGAANPAGVFVGGEPQPPPVPLLPLLEQRSREQGQRARLALDVGDQRVDQLRIHLQAGAVGGQTRWRAAVRRAATARPGCGWRRACATAPGSSRSARRSRPAARSARAAGWRESRTAATSASAKAVRSASSRHAVKTSSNWSTASTSRRSRGASATAASSASSGCSPGRTSAIVHRSLPGSTPCASAGSSPARSAEDFPLPEGPTIPSSGRAREPGDHLRHEPLAAEEERRRRRCRTRPGP